MTKKRQMVEHSNMPRLATQVCTEAGNEVKLRSAKAHKNPKTMQMAPPIRHCKTLSERNWRMMSLCVAPTARRMPISLVRSVTLTSITFMITMPPTTAEIELTRMNTAKNAELMLCQSEM